MIKEKPSGKLVQTCAVTAMVLSLFRLGVSDMAALDEEVGQTATSISFKETGLGFAHRLE